jgi:uroporphyrin-III C-methyltransferase
MSNESKHGILVVGHGSRRQEANQDVRHVAKLIGEGGEFDLVEAAFLEIESPDIKRGFDTLVERGARSVIVHPYFLSPGRHTRGDVPREVEQAAFVHTGVSYRITEPLSAHRLVIDASIERIREMQGVPATRPHLSLVGRGTVYLVGAGPGDPGLLTLRAVELLRSCDVVIYDYLVNAEILEKFTSAAERIFVGKIGGGRQTPQSEINALLIEHARMGKRVVRLKGGDPFIFGRGSEEANALRDAGIEFEIVPGVSSALAVPAYAGIPLTHRGLSSSVTFVTGSRCAEGKASFNSPGFYPSGGDTVVVLMGLSKIHEVADEFIICGRLPETPVAVISQGTFKTQKVVTGTLETVADEVEKSSLDSPALIVVGEVVRLHEHLDWFKTEASSLGFGKDLEAINAATF